MKKTFAKKVSTLALALVITFSISQTALASDYDAAQQNNNFVNPTDHDQPGPMG